MTIRECADFLKSRDGFLILSHVRPDGDTLGSCAALSHALNRMGKTAWMYPNEEITETLLPFVKPYFAPDGFEAQTIISVDVASEQMLIGNSEWNVDLCIDHHPSNTHYASETCVIPERASCGEIILDVITELLEGPDYEEAQLLYIAVSTDTGCFCYSNTNSDTFRSAAKLLDAGAQLDSLNQLLFRKTSVARLRLEGMIYSAMTFHFDNRVSVAVVSREMLDRAGATEDDCSDLANLAGRAREAVVCITIREVGENVSKLSLRSSSSVNVSEICSQFGGGGHAMAAGCTMQCSLEEAKSRILNAVEPKLP